MSRGLLALLAAGPGTTGCAFLRGYADGKSDQMAGVATQEPRGFYRLVFEDFHGLSTDSLGRSATVWKVLTAALVEYQRAAGTSVPLTEEGAVQILVQRYGFLRPTRVANWPAGAPQPRLQRPIGIVSGTVRRSLPEIELEVSNTGCSTCHTGTLYDGNGDPTFEAWVGLPSSSINLGRYAREVFAAFRLAAADQHRILGSIRTMYPSTSDTELHSIEKYYLPPLAERIAVLARTIGGFTPYSNGSPGLTNGVATVKVMLGVLPLDHLAPNEVAFVNAPDFGSLRWKRAILVDGVYAPPGWTRSGPLPATLDPAQRESMAGVVAMVTMSTLGVAPEVAARNNRPLVRDVVDYLVRDYRSPRFPGPIDAARARAGAAIYARLCESCHGRFASVDGAIALVEFPNRVVAQDIIDTDPVRVAAVDHRINDAFARTAFKRQLDARRSGGYVATPLQGLWATAPYLHNGSVPTLWHLMHPGQRPARFLVGGHKLDFARMGIAGEIAPDGVYRYPVVYRPWSLPDVHDTTQPGLGNAGHEAPFDGMEEAEKKALLEFLKCL